MELYGRMTSKIDWQIIPHGYATNKTDVPPQNRNKVKQNNDVRK
jgi:hypothetical protein